MLFEVLVSLLSCWYLGIWWRNRRLVKCAKQFKNDLWSMPIIGHAYTLIGSGEDRMRGIQKLGREALKHGGVTAVWFGYTLRIVVADPLVAEWALMTCLEKDEVFRLGRSLTGEVLAIAPVPIWRNRRKLYTPAFSPSRLAQHVDTFARHSDHMITELQAVADGGPKSLYRYLGNYSVESFFETTYGLRIKSGAIHIMATVMRSIGNLFTERVTRPWLHSETVYQMTPSYATFVKNKNTLFTCVDQIIESKRKEMTDSPKSHLKSLLGNLIENVDSDCDWLTEADLRGEVVALFIGGIDTTATALGFTLNMLAEHPDVQDKVFHELTRVVGKAPHVTADHLSELKYLEAVIKESLRLYPPAPIIIRNVDRDVTMPDGRTLVGGSSIMINIWAVNQNPLYWGEDADRFRPDRFLEGPLQPSAKFMSFSHGPRNCIAFKYAISSMKTAMATLMRRYSVRSSCNKTSQAVSFNVIIKDTNKITMYLVTRE